MKLVKFLFCFSFALLLLNFFASKVASDYNTSIQATQSPIDVVREFIKAGLSRDFKKLAELSVKPYDYLSPKEAEKIDIDNLGSIKDIIRVESFIDQYFGTPGDFIPFVIAKVEIIGQLESIGFIVLKTPRGYKVFISKELTYKYPDIKIKFENLKRIKRTIADFWVIHSGLVTYSIDYKRYPLSGADNLKVLEGTYLQRVPLKDGWGNKLFYKTSNDRQMYELSSAGPDGIMGNADDVIFENGFLKSLINITKDVSLKNDIQNTFEIIYGEEEGRNKREWSIQEMENICDDLKYYKEGSNLRYMKPHNKFPQFIEELYPHYGLKVEYKDGWGNKLSYKTSNDRQMYELSSAGPDGIIGNTDDIVFRNGKLISSK